MSYKRRVGSVIAFAVCSVLRVSTQKGDGRDDGDGLIDIGDRYHTYRHDRHNRHRLLSISLSLMFLPAWLRLFL